MPLRTIPILKAERIGLVSAADASDHRPPAPENRNWLRTGLLLATSAAFGGIAVAIWNRRTLAKFRQPTLDDE
jgi:hypothetical protein